MRNIFSVGPIAITAAYTAWAQSPVAIIHSAAPFQLRGATVSTGQGVPSWPVMPGDTFSAGTHTATLSFTDGSSIMLGPNSVGSVELSNGTPVFHLLSGSATYHLRSAGAVILTSPSGTLTPVALTGAIGAKVGLTVGFWTAAHVVVVAGVVAGGATAASLGVVAAVRSGTSVSPSQ